MPRWITVTKAPFDYRWPDRSAITAFTANGEFLVKDEVADFAVKRGYATEGKANGSKTRSTKGKTRRRARAKVRPDVPAADNGQDARVDGARLADADRPDVQLSVDPDTEQR